jgi:hypothetical protein
MAYSHGESDSNRTDKKKPTHSVTHEQEMLDYASTPFLGVGFDSFFIGFYSCIAVALPDSSLHPTPSPTQFD